METTNICTLCLTIFQTNPDKYVRIKLQEWLYCQASVKRPKTKSRNLLLTACLILQGNKNTALPMSKQWLLNIKIVSVHLLRCLISDMFGQLVFVVGLFIHEQDNLAIWSTCTRTLPDVRLWRTDYRNKTSVAVLNTYSRW